jgi:cytoskeletal protein CcmA (bactofilin family)
MFLKLKKTQLSDLVKISGVYIGPGITAEGEIKTEDDVFIDAKFKGAVKSEGVIEIGKNSNFSGSLEGRTVLVEGIAKATILASGFVSVSSCAELNGSIDASETSVAKGALVNAKITTQKQ